MGSLTFHSSKKCIWDIICFRYNIKKVGSEAPCALKCINGNNLLKGSIIFYQNFFCAPNKIYGMILSSRQSFKIPTYTNGSFCNIYYCTKGGEYVIGSKAFVISQIFMQSFTLNKKVNLSSVGTISWQNQENELFAS